MKPEGIMLSNISQPQKDKFCMLSFICGILKKSHTHQNRKESWLPAASRWGKEEEIVKRVQTFICKINEV